MKLKLLTPITLSLLLSLSTAHSQSSSYEINKQLAEQGDVSSQYNLGQMYAYGEGIPEDDTEAVKWFRLAAEQGYARAQFNLGVMCANIMFELDPIHFSTKDRSSSAEVFAEVIATIGLLVVIFATVRGGNAKLVAFSVAGYIAGAYYFTSSTSFANPAVTIGRTLSDTFAGIDPASAPLFIAAQLAGAVVAIVLIREIYPEP